MERGRGEVGRERNKGGESVGTGVGWGGERDGRGGERKVICPSLTVLCAITPNVCSRPEDGLRCRQGVKPPLNSTQLNSCIHIGILS